MSEPREPATRNIQDQMHLQQFPHLSGDAFTQPPQSAPMIRELYIPLGSRWLTLRGRFPVSTEEWAQMLYVLDAMKPGLVESAPKPPDQG